MIRYALVPALFCALALPALPALAAEGNAAPASEETSATQPAREKVICRSQLVTGSRTKKTRSCRTSREWADLKHQTREQIEKMQVVGSKY